MGNVEIDLCTTDNKDDIYAKYVLANVMVSRYETRMSEQGMPIELLKLHFTGIEQHYIGRNAANKAGKPKRAGYNLTDANLSLIS